MNTTGMSVRGSSNNSPAHDPLPVPAGVANKGHAYSKSHSGAAAIQSGNNNNANSGMDRSSSAGGGISPGGGAAAGNGLSPNNASSATARYRASVDAARSLYASAAANGGGLQPGSATNSPNLGHGFPSRSAGPGGSRRPSSDMLNNASMSGLASAGGFNAENEAIDKWFEDLHHYEATLEEMAAASLDQSFKEELGAIEQWFRVLSEAERTAALYSLLQTSSQVQIRFFITVLQQMARSDPMNALLSPAMNSASMEAQMEAKLASMGLKSPASPVVRQFARQSLGAMPITDPTAAAGFLSPNSAMLQPPQSARSVSSSSIANANSTTPSNSIHQSLEDSPDAGNLLAAHRAKLNANAANRISAPGSLFASHDQSSLRSPLWSQANSEQVAERNGRSPSPDARSSNAARSRPTSMISDHGLPSHAANTATNTASANSTSAGNMANNLSPNLGGNASGRFGAGNAAAGLEINSNLPNLADAQLSPMIANQNWAAMMNTPLMASFGPGTGNPDTSSFPNLAASTASTGVGSGPANWAAQQQNLNNIILDDAKKFRRNARSSDAGMENGGGVQGILSGMYDPSSKSTNTGNTPNARGGSPANAAAVAAQQNWRNINGINQNNSNGNNSSSALPQNAGLQSPDLSNQIMNNLAAMQNMQGLNGMASPQMQMASLLAAQQQIQQQMQLQQMMGMAAGMSPMNMMNTLQNQQMLSPVLGGLGMGMMPQSANSQRDRRSPRPSDRSVSGGLRSTFGNMGDNGNKGSAPVVPGSGSNPDEPIDLNLLSDVAAWLRSLRLHKYTANFEKSNWREMVSMDEAALEGMGVAALGARRKLLKVFENVRIQQGIPHPPGTEPRPASSGDSANANE